MRIHLPFQSLSFQSLTMRLLAVTFAVLALSASSMAQLRVSVSFGPPAIPVYEQPLCPGDGYMWTPGYWDWDADDADYFWVPGTWVLAPEAGFLWTPGWWGWGGDAFLFHEGFWGPTIGFYGGINYGFGYFGTGFVGGRWDGGHFFYNSAVWHVNESVIHNVYNERVTINNENHVSYNGGNGGVEARATSQQEEAERGRHIPPVAAQTQHVQAARGNRELRASVNQGRPSIAATEKPGDFSGHVEAAREAGAPYHPPANRGTPTGRPEENPRPAGNAAGAAVHPKDLPPAERPAAPNTGDAKLDQKYQKQQQKLAAQQDKERQKLQAQQDKEHQQYAKQQASQERTQQLEQKHQQQTQQLQQRHTSQTQQMQQRQAPAARAPRGR
jgi:hypothetical protein